MIRTVMAFPEQDQAPGAGAAPCSAHGAEASVGGRGPRFAQRTMAAEAACAWRAVLLAFRRWLRDEVRAEETP